MAARRSVTLKSRRRPRSIQRDARVGEEWRTPEVPAVSCPTDSVHRWIADHATRHHTGRQHPEPEHYRFPNKDTAQTTFTVYGKNRRRAERLCRQLLRQRPGHDHALDRSLEDVIKRPRRAARAKGTRPGGRIAGQVEPESEHAGWRRSCGPGRNKEPPERPTMTSWARPLTVAPRTWSLLVMISITTPRRRCCCSPRAPPASPRRRTLARRRMRECSLSWGHRGTATGACWGSRPTPSCSAGAAVPLHDECQQKERESRQGEHG
jgi:hypothetical protein